MAPKRERGLKQLSDGRWQFSWCYQGKYHRFKARTKTEARAMRERIKTEIRDGRYKGLARAASVPFSEAVKRFLEWSEISNRPSTFRNDKWVSSYWLNSKHLAGKPLAQITGMDLELFKQELAAMPRKASRGRLVELPTGVSRVVWSEAGRPRQRTFNTSADAMAFLFELRAKARKGDEAVLLSRRAVDIILARLKRLFSLCVAWELCEGNAAAKVKLYREDVKRVRFLSKEEEERLLAACSPYLRRIVLLALNTGMRRGELLGLRWQDIDARNGVAVIPATRAKGKRDRYVPLNKSALAILDELPEPIDRSALVFGNQAGREQEHLERHWRLALAASGLEDFHFHDLRHTFASRLAMAGVDLAVLRELLGHRDFQMTLRYAHLTPSHLKRAVAILADPNLHENLHAKEGEG